jgi:hypothetical protein
MSPSASATRPLPYTIHFTQYIFKTALPEKYVKVYTFFKIKIFSIFQGEKPIFSSYLLIHLPNTLAKQQRVKK